MKLRGLGVVTLVMAMVVSMAGLASADDPGTETATTPTTVAPGYDTSFNLGFAGELISFVLFWGNQAEIDDIAYPPSPCLDTTLESTVTPVSTDTTSVCLDVAGPNGQVNHGTFVSSFVHWLKSPEGMALLGSYDGPRGQLVKQAAKDGFGKGPKAGDETSIVETEDGQPKGWSNPHNPHSNS